MNPVEEDFIMINQNNSEIRDNFLTMLRDMNLRNS